MSIIDTLITDRTQADVTKLKSLLSKPRAMWTNEEWSDFILAKDKGAYNATDLNRVQEAMEYLAERFRGYGYNVPEIKRPSITEVIPGTSRLPEGYTELEYIRSTGEQYVDTLFIPNQDTKLELKFQTSQTSAGGIAVCDSEWQSNAFGVWVNAAGYGNATDQKVIHYGQDEITLVLDKNKLYKDGTLTWTATESIFQTTHALTLMALRRNGSMSEYLSGKLYYCKLWDNGTSVRDYVPCLNPSNEVGLYDIVNGVFYGNAGTGYFLPGPAVSLPEGYRRLEYVRSTGTQYVDTGLTANNNTAIAVDVHLNGSENATVPYGVWDSGNPTNAFLFYAMRSSNAANIFYGTKRQSNVAGSYFTRGILIQNKNVFSFNGTVLGTLETQTFQSSNNMFLFAWNAAGTVADLSTMDIYSCAIHNDNVLARLYTPVLTAGGEIGLYDSITREFYGNAGTGTFVAGDELGSSDGNIPTQIIERDYWKIGDIPRKAQMDQYLTNLGYVKNVLGLLKSAPESPFTMDYLTYTEANDIEQILVDIEFVITHTIQSMYRLNGFMFVSGYRPFPSSASDYGRTWDDIDDLELNWDDLDDGEAWYTMQYGVIK